MTYTCANPACDNYGVTWEDSVKEHICPECGEEAEEVSTCGLM